MTVKEESVVCASPAGATIAEFNDFIQHAGLGKNKYVCYLLLSLCSSSFCSFVLLVLLSHLNL